MVGRWYNMIHNDDTHIRMTNDLLIFLWSTNISNLWQRRNPSIGKLSLNLLSCLTNFPISFWMFVDKSNKCFQMLLTAVLTSLLEFPRILLFIKAKRQFFFCLDQLSLSHQGTCGDDLRLVAVSVTRQQNSQNNYWSCFLLLKLLCIWEK